MTKKEILDLLDKYCGNDHAVEKYISEIKGMLTFIKSNEEIADDGKECVIICKKYIEKQPTALESDIKRKQAESVFALKEYLGTAIQIKADNLQIGNRVYDSEIKYQHTLMNKMSGKRKFFICFLSLTLLTAIVFTVLMYVYKDIEIFKEIPNIIGLVDLIFGISFFIYEQIDDSKKKENICRTLEAVETNDANTIVKRNKEINKNINKIKGDNNVTDNMIGGDCTIIFK